MDASSPQPLPSKAYSMRSNKNRQNLPVAHTCIRYKNGGEPCSLLTFFVAAEHRSQRIQFKARPMHWLTKGWPGLWYHSTPLCSPMQRLCFDLNSFASMFCLFLSCPPPHFVIRFLHYASSLPPRDHARVGGHRR